MYTRLFESESNTYRPDNKMNRRTYGIRCLKLLLFLAVSLGIFWSIVHLLTSKKGFQLTNFFSSKFAKLGHFGINFEEEKFTLTDDSDNIYLSGKWLMGIKESPTECREKLTFDDAKVKHACYVWKRKAKLEIQFSDKQHESIGCHHVTWTSYNTNITPHQCFSLPGANWYGGFQVNNQQWPLEKTSVSMRPYIAGLPSDKNRFVSVVERFWVNSRGVGISIDHGVPLEVSFNSQGDKQFCIRGKYDRKSFYGNGNLLAPFLVYTVCKAPSVLSVFKYMRSTSRSIGGKPNDLPGRDMFEKPVWTTASMNLSQKSFLHYTKKILDLKLPHSHIDIVGKYMDYYGDFKFSRKLFPHNLQILQELTGGVPVNRNLSINLYVTPFANPGSLTYKYGESKGFWIKNRLTNKTLNIKWDHGEGALLDLSNPLATSWFTNHLKQLKTLFPIHSFKFHGGEPIFSNYDYQLNEAARNPNHFTTHYVEMAFKMGNFTDIRSVYSSQTLPIFVRLMEKDSIWGYENGLKSIIPSVLMMGIIGYPFVSPGFIGGRVKGKSLPDRELYIRWLELAAYLPVMEFAVGPWQFDSNTTRVMTDLVSSYISKHTDEVAPLLLSAAKEAPMTGYPIIRPVWWLDPKDKDALEIDNEFLIGSGLLVAPVLEKGGRARDIYLPQGIWQDMLNKKDVHGPKWLRSYHVKLEQIATFILKMQL